MLLDSLEVKMKREADSEELSEFEEFKWDIINYEKDFIWLQIDFKNPQNIGTFYSQDYLSVTFWGVEFFKSFQGVEVELGTEIVWKI